MQPRTTTQALGAYPFQQCEALPFTNIQPASGVGYCCKITFVGDAAVGKTSLLINFNNGFNGTGPLEHELTMGAQYLPLYYMIPSDKQEQVRHLGASVPQKFVALQLWDTAGQERFRSIVPGYIRGSFLIIMMFDVTNPETLKNLLSIWMQVVIAQMAATTRILWVANKCDRYDDITLSDLMTAYWTEIEAASKAAAKATDNHAFDNPILINMSAMNGTKDSGFGSFIEYIKHIIEAAPYINDNRISPFALVDKTTIVTSHDGTQTVKQSCGC